jgi:hypothetical protein
MTLRRRGRAAAPAPVIAGGQPELCDFCAAVISDGTEAYATVPDSSAAHPFSSLLDGQRRLTACCPAHLDQLASQYATRPYDEDELQAHVVARAQRRIGPDATLDDLAFVTGLSVAQVMRAARWQSIWMFWLPDPEPPDS